MSALVVDVADAIVDLLNGETWSESFTATRTYLPKGNIKDGDFNSLRVTVVPRSYEPTAITRTMVDEDIWIDIAVQYKTGNDNAGIDTLVGLCEEIATFMRMRAIGTTPAATCYEVLYSPILISEHLEKFGVFTGMVTVKCKAVR